MYLVKDLDQIHSVLLTYFCLHFGTEGVLAYPLLWVELLNNLEGFCIPISMYRKCCQYDKIEKANNSSSYNNSLLMLIFS
jgi:hypothetical protein